MVTRFLVSYDIREPERLRRVHGIVRGYGERVQYSVYEVLLTAKERVQMEAQLREVMNLKEDQVLWIALGDAEQPEVKCIDALGLSYRPQQRGSLIV